MHLTYIVVSVQSALESSEAEHLLRTKRCSERFMFLDAFFAPDFKLFSEILNYFQRFTVFTGHSLAYTVYSSISFRSAIRLSWMIFALFAIASGGLAFYMCFGKDSPTLRFDRDSCRLPFVPFTCFLCMSLHSCTTLHSNKVWSFSSAAHYSSLTAQT